jgi:7-carboxy-7-deazaguanine synthase
MLSLNTQPKEPVVSFPNGALQVFKIWKTLQGEGPLVGTPAIFVRLSGCVLDCGFCDTDYTSSRTLMTPTDILQEVRSIKGPSWASLIVLTGGEPFRQDIKRFVHAAIDDGFTVQIETNGTLYCADLNYNMVNIVCSPKTPKVNGYLTPHIDAWKYILDGDNVDPNDGLPSSTLGVNLSPARPPENFPRSKIYVQPLDVQDEQLNRRNQQAAIQSCMKFGYRYSHQLHKTLGLE